MPKAGAHYQETLVSLMAHKRTVDYAGGHLVKLEQDARGFKAPESFCIFAHRLVDTPWKSRLCGNLRVCIETFPYNY